MAIDTLNLAKRLREAGFNEAQAEAVAAAVREGTEGAELATKSDLALAAAELRAEIANVRAEMREIEQRLTVRIANEISAVRSEIAALKSDLLVRMLQMVLAAVVMNAIAMAGLLFAFAKLLGH
jgi:DNA-binding transcriptional MerR regulator